MPFYLRIPLGFLIMAIGYLMIRKSLRFVEWFGAIPWAEQKLGYGKSDFFYKLIGVAVALLGALVTTNVISGILEDFAGIFIKS